jgi:hypothetical protein
MKIETKLNIGDTGYFILHNKVYSAKVKSIDVFITENSIRERYQIHENPAGRQYSCFWYDYEFFATKDELLKLL